MKRKDKERLLIMTADIKRDIKEIEILGKDLDDHSRNFKIKVRLNQLWLTIDDLEYFMIHS